MTILSWQQRQPCYQELQGLWREAGQAGNGPFQEKVAQLGQELVAAFRFETRSQGKPEGEYRSGDVRLGVAERGVIYAVGHTRGRALGERER